jgi:hypothetical protein
LSAIQQAFADAAPYLREFEAALKRGRLVICGQCSSFTFAGRPADVGHCGRYTVEAWPLVPFRCAGFERRQKKTA